MNSDAEQVWSILLPAFLVGLLVLSTHIPLGREVLNRGIIFLDLAVAQMAAFGLILANQLGKAFGGDYGHPFMTQSAAICSAVLGASLLYAFRRWAAPVQEALIGVMFMLAASGGILLLAADPHGGERLRDLLAGQILWVDYPEMAVALLVYMSIWGILYWAPRLVQGYGFYPLFAVAVTVSTQLVGIYLVFASLIIPALASQSARKPLRSAFGVGITGYSLGLWLSLWWDLPSGALITWTLGLTGLLYASSLALKKNALR